MESDDDEVYAAQAAVMQGAWAFAGAFWVDHDMRATWKVTHPTMRRCWAQTWLLPMLDHARAEGYDPDEVIEAFTADRVEHELWRPFARTTIKGATLPVQRDTWGMKVNPDFVAPDVMLVRLLPIPEGGSIRPDEQYVSVPLLMQYDDGPGWRLLNMVSEQIPEPGWPPRL